MKTDSRWMFGLVLALGTTASAQSVPVQSPQPASKPSTTTSAPAKPDAAEATSQPTEPAPNTPILPEGVTKFEEPDPSGGVVPDTRPLSGAQEITTGTRSRPGRKYLVPSLSISESYDTKAFTLSGTREAVATTVIGGSLELHRAAGAHDFSATYQGGATLGQNQNQASNSFHRLGLQQTVMFRRVGFMLGDELSYLPESQIGYGRYISTDVNQSLIDLKPGLNPSQSIITGQNSRISNTALGEITFRLDRSSSITATSSYGLLRFLEGSGLQDSTQLTSSIGYDRALTVRDQVAVAYNVSQFNYDQSPVSVRSQSVQASYARRLNGRLAVRVAGGPQFLSFEDVPGATGGVPVTFSGSAQLTYGFRNSELGMGYSRGTTGGSGIITAAESDVVNAMYSRKLARNLNVQTNFAYARNNSLSPTMTGPASQFQTVTGRVSVTRDLGRTTNIFFSYDVQHQSTQNVSCTGVLCDFGVRHIFGVGFGWHAQPIRID